jgi:hypothetical protein
MITPAHSGEEVEDTDAMDTTSRATISPHSDVPMEPVAGIDNPTPTPTHDELPSSILTQYSNLFIDTTIRCQAQRAALLKSLLNFLKRTLQDGTMAESVQNSEFTMELLL